MGATAACDAGVHVASFACVFRSIPPSVMVEVTVIFWSFQRTCCRLRCAAHRIVATPASWMAQARKRKRPCTVSLDIKIACNVTSLRILARTLGYPTVLRVGDAQGVSTSGGAHPIDPKHVTDQMPSLMSHHFTHAA
jgi:hypothetical protein